jgi:hypothetical protein
MRNLWEKLYMCWQKGTLDGKVADVGSPVYSRHLWYAPVDVHRDGAFRCEGPNERWRREGLDEHRARWIPCGLREREKSICMWVVSPKIAPISTI